MNLLKKQGYYKTHEMYQSHFFEKKQYHRDVLLEGTQYKDTIAVYNRIKNSIGKYGKKSKALTLF